MKHVWNTSCISWEDSGKEGNHLRDVGVDRSIILEYMLNKFWDGEIWLDSSCSGQGQVLGCCAHGNEPSCSIFDDWLWSCWLLQKHCAAWSLLFAVRFSETHGVKLVCCVLYRFVFTECFLAALTALTELRTAHSPLVQVQIMCDFWLQL